MEHMVDQQSLERRSRPRIGEVSAGWMERAEDGSIDRFSAGVAMGSNLGLTG